MTKVKSLGSATGMPEHLFYLANGQIKLLNMTDAKIDVSSKKKVLKKFKEIQKIFQRKKLNLVRNHVGATYAHEI